MIVFVSTKGFFYVKEFYINKNKPEEFYYQKGKSKKKVQMKLENNILKIKLEKKN